MSAMVVSPLHCPMEVKLYNQADCKTKMADLPTFDGSSIRRISKLGSGCHSDVYFVVTAQSRQQLALKCINHSTIPNQAMSASLTNDLMSEAQILAGLDHENIIKVRGVSSVPFNAGDSIKSDTASSEYFFLMDVLSDTLMDRVQRWSKDESCYTGIRSSILGNRFRKLAYQKMMFRMRTVAIGVADGMAYLHSKGIVLQDLKPVCHARRQHTMVWSLIAVAHNPIFFVPRQILGLTCKQDKPVFSILEWLGILLTYRGTRP